MQHSNINTALNISWLCATGKTTKFIFQQAPNSVKVEDKFGQIKLHQVVCALLSVFAIFWNRQFAQLPCKYSDTLWSPLDNSSIAWLPSKSLLHSFVPYCTVFYCTLLCCLGLNYTALNLTALDCTHWAAHNAMYSTVLYSGSLFQCLTVNCTFTLPETLLPPLVITIALVILGI